MNYLIAKQHVKSKYQEIERIHMLVDRNSFREIGSGMINYVNRPPI